MSLLVDTAVGSKQLIPELEKAGLPVEPANLPFGDIAFYGRGREGAELYIGVEYKQLGELVQSLTTKRLQGHQLLGLTQDFDRRYLLIEGPDFDHDSYGRPNLFKTKKLYGCQDAFVLEQEMINLQTNGGVTIVQRANTRNSIRFLKALYRYWTDKSLDKHKSHMAMYAPDLDERLKQKQSIYRHTVFAWKGVGLEVSGAVEDYVRSKLGPKASRKVMLQYTLNMKLAEWAELSINGRRLGEKRAREIIKGLESVE